MPRSSRAPWLPPRLMASRATVSFAVPSYAIQARAGKVDGFAGPPVASRPAPGCPRHRRRPTALPIQHLILPSIRYPRSQQHTRRRSSRDPTVASLWRRRPSRRETRSWLGLVAMLFANTPAAIAPWGGGTGSLRHQSDCLRVPSSKMSASIVVRFVAVERATRPYSRGEAERRDDPRGLGLRFRQTDPRIPAALAGTWRRSATPRARRSRLWSNCSRPESPEQLRRRSLLVPRRQGPTARHRAIAVAFDPAAFGGYSRLDHFAALAASIETQPGRAFAGHPASGSRREKAAREGVSVSDVLLAEISKPTPI